MNFSREDAEFISLGTTLRGWLFRPEGSDPSPGVVMAHGLTAVREMFLERYAAAFAAAGFATLVYDHVGFGASDGEPRQNPDPVLQMEGYRDAVAWLRQQPLIDSDRIGIWGTGFSGAQVITLASENLPIRCAVAQVPEFGPLEPSEATVAAMTDALANERLDEMIPAVSATSDGLGLMYSDDAYGWFTRVSRERAPSWRNEVRIGALADPIDPIESLPMVKIPLRCIVAPEDKLAPPQPGIEVAGTIPMVDFVEIPGNHFRAFEAGFAESSAHAIEWFARHLKV